MLCFKMWNIHQSTVFDLLLFLLLCRYCNCCILISNTIKWNILRVTKSGLCCVNTIVHIVSRMTHLSMQLLLFVCEYLSHVTCFSSYYIVSCSPDCIYRVCVDSELRNFIHFNVLDSLWCFIQINNQCIIFHLYVIS